MKIATRSPTGIAIRAASATMIAEPTIALEMPPLVSPKSPVGVVRKWMLSAPIPLSDRADHDQQDGDGEQRGDGGDDLDHPVDAVAPLQVAAVEQQRVVAHGITGRALIAPRPRLVVMSVSFSVPRWTISRATRLTITAKTSRIKPR